MMWEGSSYKGAFQVFHGMLRVNLSCIPTHRSRLEDWWHLERKLGTQSTIQTARRVAPCHRWWVPAERRACRLGRFATRMIGMGNLRALRHPQRALDVRIAILKTTRAGMRSQRKLTIYSARIASQSLWIIRSAAFRTNCRWRAR